MKSVAAITSLILATGALLSPANASSIDPAVVALDIPAAWNLGLKGNGAAIAFVDSELDINHPEFHGAVIQGYCVVTEPNSPQVCPNGQKEMIGKHASSWSSGNDDHGNMVAGNIRRVAPQANLLPIRAIGGTPALLKASEFLLTHQSEYGVVALSLSIGTDLFWGAGPRAGWASLTCEALAQTNPEMRGFANNLERLRDQGLVTFAAAGNSPTLDFNRFFFPACLKSVVSVGALGRDNTVAPYVTMSTDVEFLAPDYAVVATGGGGVRQGGGTSAATPMVAGSFALLRAGFPGLSPEVILAAMKAGSNKIDDAVIKGLNIPQLGATAKSLGLISAAEKPSSSSSVGSESNSSSSSNLSSTSSSTSSTRPTESPSGGTTKQPVNGPAIQVSRVIATWLKWTSTGQSTLGEKGLREKIAKLVRGQKGAFRLVCSGVVPHGSSVVETDLAKRRAANSCAYARKTAPGLETQYQVKVSEVRSYVNSVLLQLSVE